MSVLAEPETENEPRNVGRSSGKTRGGPAKLLRAHKLPSSSNDSRWVNTFKNARKFQPRETHPNLQLADGLCERTEACSERGFLEGMYPNRIKGEGLEVDKRGEVGMTRRGAASMWTGEYAGISLRDIT